MNREPDLSTACRAYGGIEDPSGGFVFQEAEIAMQAARLLGVELNIATPLLSREAILKQHKDGRIVAIVERKGQDVADKMEGWLPKKNQWTKIYNAQLSAPLEIEVGNYDDVVRHLVTESQEDYGWMLKTDGKWRLEPITHLRIALSSLGLNAKEVTTILGGSVFKAWTVVNKPFQPEYPGDREWNRKAAQLRFLPSQSKENLKYQHWSKVLNHCGSGLDDTIKQTGWARANGILTGGDYLKCWVASLFKEPLEPLPYLFFYGPQNSGKTVFHESLSTLFRPGYVRADISLTNPSGFNGELENAVLCAVEETDLKANKMAYNRIKDWVTSMRLPIHAKMKTPIHVNNATHWVQTANEERACPVFPGDTRIVIIPVKPLEKIIPRRHLNDKLEAEAPDFLAALLSLELPPTNDRLNLPVVMTREKEAIEETNKTDLQVYLEEHIHYVPGCLLPIAEFYQHFTESLEGAQVTKWSKIRIGREMPQDKFPKGRRKDGTWCYGNMSLVECEPKSAPLYRPLGSEFLEIKNDTINNVEQSTP